MTKEFEYLMHLLAASAKGAPARPPEDEVSWERIFSLAEEQQIVPLIASVVKKHPSLGCPRQLAAEKRAAAFTAVLTDCARRGSAVALLEEMEHAGMPAFVVKGMAAAANYAAPENRISGDMDICIDPDQEEPVCEFLRRHGCVMTPRWENGHHAAARHPELGLIEVHVRLYDELVEDIWFRKVDPALLIREPRQKIVTDNGAYDTLGPTDHLIFMTLHMIKHFISCGMSLRMMMDVALQIVKHRAELDMDRFWLVVDTLNYRELVNSILWAMVRCCDFHSGDFPGIGSCQTDHVTGILEDVETGGWLGMNDAAARRQSGYVYNRHLMLKQRSKWQYWLYMLQWQHSFKLSTLFPGKKRLAQDYPWVLKRPWLIPAAWVHRIIFKGSAALRKEKLTSRIILDENDVNRESAKRLDLFRQLGML